MKRPRNKKTRRQRAFTLVETLVAISILLVAIVGPMTIAARGLQSAFYAREQIAAFSLAQEGVELIRAIRDTNALQTPPANWLANIPGVCGSSSQGCGIDVRSGTIINCNSQSCQLNYDASALLGRRGFYTYASCGTNCTLTPFTRRIWVDPLPGGREAEITVEVSWQSGLFGNAKTVTIQSEIFNQYDNL